MVYPLPTPSIGVNQKVDFWSTDQCSSEAGAVGILVNHGGALRILINVWWDVGRANILPIGVIGYTGLT